MDVNRSQYISDPNPFKKKSTWTPNKDRDLGLELFIQLLKNDILNSKGWLENWEQGSGNGDWEWGTGNGEWGVNANFSF